MRSSSSASSNRSSPPPPRSLSSPSSSSSLPVIAQRHHQTHHSQSSSILSSLNALISSSSTASSDNHTKDKEAVAAPPSSIRPSLSSSGLRTHVKRGEESVRHHIHASTAKLVELEDQLLTNKQELSKRDEYTSGLQRNCEALSLLCTQRIQEIISLRAELEENKQHIQLLQSEESRYLNAEANANRLMKENAIYIEKQKSIESEVIRLSSRISVLESELRELGESRDELTMQLAQSQGLVLTRSNELQDARIEIQRMQSIHMNQTHTQQQELIQEYNEKQVENNEKFKEIIKQAEIKLQKTQNLLLRAEQDRDNGQSDIARLKKSVSLLRSENATLRSSANESTQRAETAEKERSNELAELIHLRSLSRTLDDKLKFSEKTRETLKKQFDSVWSTKVDLELQLNQLNQDLNIARTTANINAKSDTNIAEVKQKFEAAMIAKSALEQMNQELTKKISKIQSELDESKASLSTSQAQRLELETSITALRSKLSQSEDELRSSRSLHSTSSQETNARIQNMSHSQQKTNDELNSKQMENQQLKLNIADLNKQIHLLQTKAKTLTKSLEDAQALHSKEMEELDLRSQKELADKMSAMQSNHSLLNARLLELESEKAELSSLLDVPRLSEKDIARLKKQEKELSNAIAKLIINEEASEASFTCYSCLKIFTNPVTCIPCGHSYCKLCIQKSEHCPQCGKNKKVDYYANELLEELASKYVYRKQALAAIKAMTIPLSGSSSHSKLPSG